MRLAILGDVHANLEALETVIEATRKEKVEGYYCVGDLWVTAPNRPSASRSSRT